MSRLKLIKAFFAVVLLFTTMACGLTGTPAGPLPPTVSAEDLQATVNAAATISLQTIAANLTNTALALPTDTPEPSATPTLRPSSTIIPSNTPPAVTATPLITRAPTRTHTPVQSPTNTAQPTSEGYNCTLIAISPAIDTVIGAGNDFDVRWTIKNSGSQTWDSGDVDYRWFSGDKLHTGNDVYDLAVDVLPNGTIDIIIDVKAPTTVGTYGATWRLMRSDRVICTFDYRFKVK
ncbi:MAG TPA: NBR1-Ig-like domain-containing protein [Anaerolineaceae bacterium]|nr:NBR1-Ig-like domain-containing protein [Anaerolineaceae bacterium]